VKTAAKILLGILSVLYPLLWYYGREQGWFYPLAGFMLLLWLARAAMQRDSGQRRVSLLVAAFFAAVLLFRRPDSMYWYPVWVNGLLLLLFGLSLTQKQSLIERLARLQHPDLPPEGVAYTRRAPVRTAWHRFFHSFFYLLQRKVIFYKVDFPICSSHHNSTDDKDFIFL